MKCEVERSVLSPRKENFSGKRDFLKGRPKFPKGISEWKILLFSGLLAWIAFDAIFREKVLEMERGHPRRNFHSGFDTCHLLQLSTNRFFRVNGKQPGVNFRFSLVILLRINRSTTALPILTEQWPSICSRLNPGDGVGWSGVFAYPRNNPKTFDALIVPCNFGLDSMWQRTQKRCCSLIYSISH